MEAGAVARTKNNAQRLGQTIVFVDESGLSERPHRYRTWARARPMLQYHFRWKTLSLMASITWWNFYFKLFPGVIKAPQIIEFLQHLMRYLRPPLARNLERAARASQSPGARLRRRAPPTS